MLKCLDRFDFPHPIRQVLESRSILHDRDEIAAMLKDAPSCSDGELSWNRRLTALLVLETAEVHCHELWRAASKADPKIMKQTEVTLSSWLEQLCDIVMARSDGRFLGSQWLLRKMADERMERARREHSEEGGLERLRQEDMIEWIALGLSNAGLKGSEIEAVVGVPKALPLQNISPVKSAQSDDRPEIPRLGALSMSAFLEHMIGETSPQGVGKLLGRLDVLMALRDPASKSKAFWPQMPVVFPRIVVATCLRTRMIRLNVGSNPGTCLSNSGDALSTGMKRKTGMRWHLPSFYLLLESPPSNG